MSKQRACFSLLLLICSAAFTNSAICEVGNVDLEFGWFSPYENPTVIQDDYQGIVETFNTTNVTSVRFETVKYLDLSYKDNKLSISTTPEFKNYDINENSNYFRTTVYVECSNGARNESYQFTYHQTVKDINNYAPVFNRESYIYEFYGQFDKEFEVTSMMPISATDLDFSTYEISFDIENTPDFEIDYRTRDKIGYFEMYTLTYVSPPYNKTFTLTARDNFKGESKNTTTTLTIILHPPSETLSFAKSEYKAQIISNNLEVSENIALASGVDDCTQLKVISEYSEFFKASVDHLRNGIRLELVKPIPLPRSYTSIDITIEATWKGLVATSKVTVTSDKDMALLCKLGDVDLTKKSYRNPVDIYDDHKGVVQVFNKTLNVAGVDCSQYKYMKCSFSNGIVTVETTDDFKNYERDELEAIMAKNMTLQCPYENITLEYRQFILDINNHDPLFDKKEYTYVFYNQIPEDLSLTDIMPIKVEDLDLSNTRFEVFIEPEEEFYFYVGSKDKKGADCELYAEQDINPGFKKNYVLRVKDSGDPKRSSTAKLTIEVKDEHLLNFTKEEYTSLILNESFSYSNDKIEIVGGFDEDLHLNLRSEYIDYFQVKPDMARKEILVSLLKAPGEIKELATRVKIEAEWKGFKAETVLNIHLNGKLPTTPLLSSEGTTPTPSLSESYGELSGFNNWIFASTLSQIVIISVSCVSLLAMIVIAYRYYFAKVLEKPEV